jgi:hypothetical protein
MFAYLQSETKNAKQISGYYQRRLAQSFNEGKYNQKIKVETVLSGLERKFGGYINVWKFLLRGKVIKIKSDPFTLSQE